MLYLLVGSIVFNLLIKTNGEGGDVIILCNLCSAILLPAALAAAETKKFATKDTWFY